jgi:DNA polymerase-3 subunit delta
MAGLAEIEEAVAKIKSGKLPAFVLVTGDQDYLVKQAYDRLLEAAVPADLRAFNCEQVDGSRIELKDLLAAWEIVPMMPGPKALGVLDARFFQSKSSAADLLARARGSWEKKEINPALRHLGRVLALLDWNWNFAQGKSLQDFSEALEGEDLGAASLEGPWLGQALQQGLASDFPLPSAADESGELLEGLQASLKAGAAQRMLIFSAASADGRKKLFKFVQEHGLVLDFKAEKKGPQATQTASVFLRNLLSQRSLSMPMALAQRFVGAYGHDLGLMARELEKIEAFAHPRKELSAVDLSEVGTPASEDSVFELLELLSRGASGLGQALDLLSRLVRGEGAAMLFNLLASEIRMLLLCRALIDEGKVPGRGLSEFFQYKTGLHAKLSSELPSGLAALWKKKHAFACFQALKRAQNMNQETLKAYLDRVLEADLRIKSGRGQMDRELFMLCTAMAGLEEEVYA